MTQCCGCVHIVCLVWSDAGSPEKPPQTHSLLIIPFLPLKGAIVLVVINTFPFIYSSKKQIHTDEFSEAGSAVHRGGSSNNTIKNVSYIWILFILISMRINTFAVQAGDQCEARTCWRYNSCRSLYCN